MSYMFREDGTLVLEGRNVRLASTVPASPPILAAVESERNRRQARIQAAEAEVKVLEQGLNDLRKRLADAEVRVAVHGFRFSLADGHSAEIHVSAPSDPRDVEKFLAVNESNLKTATVTACPVPDPHCRVLGRSIDVSQRTLERAIAAFTTVFSRPGELRRQLRDAEAALGSARNRLARAVQESKAPIMFPAHVVLATQPGALPTWGPPSLIESAPIEVGRIFGRARP